MNKKIKIIIIIVLILLLSIGSTIAFLHETKPEKDNNLLLVRCQDDSCETKDTTTTKKVSTTTTSTTSTSTTSQVVITTTTTTVMVQSQQPANVNPVGDSSGATQGGTTVTESNTGTQTNEQHIVYQPTSDDDVVMHGDDTINVRDEYQQWGQNTIIRLLRPGEFLVPGKGGTYDWNVDNIVEEDVVYMATFSEDNKFNANILYKLKRNGEYIAGSEDEWIHFEEMNFKGRTLAPGETDTYNLEWKWIDAPNDTEVGHSENATYSFGMYIMAYEEIDYVPEYLGQGDGSASEDDEGIQGFINLLNPKTGDEIYIYMILVVLSTVGLVVIRHYRGNKDESI